MKATIQRVRGAQQLAEKMEFAYQLRDVEDRIAEDVCPELRIHVQVAGTKYQAPESLVGFGLKPGDPLREKFAALIIEHSLRTAGATEDELPALLTQIATGEQV